MCILHPHRSFVTTRTTPPSGDWPEIDPGHGPRFTEGGRKWVAARAQNALRRTGLIVAVGTLTFLAALVALVLIPRQARRAATIVAPQPAERPDTLAILARSNAARDRLAASETALASARARLDAPPPPPPPRDTLAPELVARRDSLQGMVRSLDALLERVQSAPLPASYRALGDAPVLRGEPIVQSLLDSLTVVERERDAFGAAAGVDPVFVALTSRAIAIGRSIQEIAEDRRSTLRQEAAELAPPPPPPPPPRPIRVDTMPTVFARDSAVAALEAALRDMARARAVNAALDARAAQARELASIGAPPVARFAAAVILGLFVGFAVALGAEVRRPRVADEREVERVTGARVLATIRPAPPAPERSRRRADLEAPPLLDQSGGAYRMLYLHLAASGASLPFVTITGEDPETTTVVAANVAAAAAADARSALIVDADLKASLLARVLQLRRSPGLGEVISEANSWAEAITTKLVGRDNAIDVVTAGSGAVDVPERLAPTLRHDLRRLTRRYDLVVLLADVEHVASGDRSMLPAPDVVYVARTGRSSLFGLAAGVKAMRAAGTRVRGVVLWDSEPPDMPVSGEAADEQAGTPAERSPAGSM